MVSIRRAGPPERACARAILEEYNEAVGVVIRDDDASFAEYLNGTGAFWLAESGGQVIGCVALRSLPEVAPKACEVKRLYVRPEHRKIGAARALMDAAEAYARSAGYEAIYLDTFEDLADAVRFYERRGYQPVPRYNANPQATIFMRLLLCHDSAAPFSS